MLYVVFHTVSPIVEVRPHCDTYIYILPPLSLLLNPIPIFLISSSAASSKRRETPPAPLFRPAYLHLCIPPGTLHCTQKNQITEETTTKTKSQQMTPLKVETRFLRVSPKRNGEINTCRRSEERSNNKVRGAQRGRKVRWLAAHSVKGFHYSTTTTNRLRIHQQLFSYIKKQQKQQKTVQRGAKTKTKGGKELRQHAMSSYNSGGRDKVQTALQLFASLRDSSSFPLPPPPLWSDKQRGRCRGAAQKRKSNALQEKADRDADDAIATYEAQQRAGGRGGKLKSSQDGNGVVFFGTSSEAELKSMTSRELIRKLATSEAIVKRLHEKNKKLARDLEEANAMNDAAGTGGGGGGRVGSSGTAGKPRDEAQALRKAMKEMRARHDKELEEKDEQLQQQQEKQSRLSALLSDLEEKLRALQAIDQQQQQQRASSSGGDAGRAGGGDERAAAEKRGSGFDGAADRLRELEEKIQRLEVEKEVLCGHLFQAEKRNRQLEDELRRTQEQLEASLGREQAIREDLARQPPGDHLRTTRPPQDQPAASPHPSESPPRRHMQHADDETPGSLSQYYSVLQDAITALQFRLHQTQAEKQQLQALQLQALLETPNEPLPKINAEVKKLFSVMKRVMLSESIEHEAQRERMNEILYVLEKEVASVGLQSGGAAKKKYRLHNQQHANKFLSTNHFIVELFLVSVLALLPFVLSPSLSYLRRFVELHLVCSSIRRTSTPLFLLCRCFIFIYCFAVCFSYRSVALQST
eukprot:gene11757-8085_t